MPGVRVGDIPVYYEVHGAGYPILWIRGLGSNGDHWYEQIPAFSSRYRCITFDNRGIGRSGKPDIPYTIAMMAEDTVGLMDALHIPKGHIVGLSMGGMIAQRIAIDHGDRVHGLVLVATHCGGSRAVRASEGVSKTFGEYLMTCSEEASEKAMACLFTPKTRKERPESVRRYQETSRRFPPSPAFLMHQWQAVQGHDTWEELPRITAPTLVLTGSEDVLVPPENARILSERIPRARMEVIEGGGHQVCAERPEVFNEVVLRFLDALG